jgi:integrase
MAAADSTAVLPLETLLRERGKFLDALSAPNTQRGYRYDWQAFCRWCDAMGLASLPATSETLGLYVTARLSARRKITTVRRNAAAVHAVHRDRGQHSPLDTAVLDILRGARRSRIEPVRQVRPVNLEDLRAIAKLLRKDDTARAIRDLAIMLVGFAGALRTATLAALALADVAFSERGASLWIPREKQDQEGRGRLIGLPHGKHPETCPVHALRDWIARRGEFPGPLFTRLNGGEATHAMQPERFGQLVQRCLARTGRDFREYGGHSLRAGFCTEAGEQGAGELLIAAQTGHKDMGTLRRYFRRQDVFRVNACALIDL